MAEFEITPAPSDEERRAVMEVLADWLQPSEPAAYASAWRRSGLPDERDEL